MEGADQSGEASTSSDDQQIVLALRKMIKAIEVMAIHVEPQAIWPFQEDLIRKVKEELQSALAQLSTVGNRNLEYELMMPRERHLRLKFLGEVSAPVLTGKAIEGKGGTPLRVALVDEITGEVVVSGPESRAEVEILVLESSGRDDYRNRSRGEIDSMITGKGDKKKPKSKPHIAKGKYVCLEDGIGVLHNSRMGHGSVWTKACNCRLGAKIVENPCGVKVQEAWTESFEVLDNRSIIYGKHYPPSLSDEIWRLKEIDRNGPIRKRLNEGRIFTVRNFLFLQSIDPQRLQEIAANPKQASWKKTVDHACKCEIDDNRIYSYPSSKYETRIAFDAVGGLKGVIRDSHVFPVDSLSEPEKAKAHELLLSAFEKQKDLTYPIDETSLLNQFPCRSSSVNAATNPTQRVTNTYEDSVSGSVDQDDPMKPGTSSQSMSLPTCHVGSLGSITMEQTHHLHLDDPHKGPSCSSDPHALSELDDFINLSWKQMYELLTAAKPHFLQQSIAGALRFVVATKVMLWVVRTRKKFMHPGDFQVQKKRRLV